MNFDIKLHERLTQANQQESQLSVDVEDRLITKDKCDACKDFLSHLKDHDNGLIGEECPLGCGELLTTQ